jgi:Fic family protein
VPAGFLADAIVDTADELLVTREALATLSMIWRERRKFRQGSAALKALDILPHYPVLTIRRLADILEVSIPAATQAIEQLVEGRMLTERTGYARNRVFACPEALMIINRPFGEVPILPDAKSSPSP